MAERKLVGIDLGVSSKHTVVVLRGDGGLLGRRSCIPTRRAWSTSSRPRSAAPPRDPSGGCRRAHRPGVVAGSGVLREARSPGLSGKFRAVRRSATVPLRHAKSNRIDADALARLPLFVDHLKPVRLPTGDQASLERRVRLCDRLVAEAGSRKTRIRALVREMLPMTPLADGLTKADLAILERTGGNPRRLLEMGRTRLVRLVKKTSHGHLGEDRAVVWMDAAQQSLELYQQSPAIAFEDRADAVKTELALLKTCEAELAKHQLQREAGYRRVDPDQLMCSLPGVAEVGAPVLSVFLVQPSRYPNGRHFVSYTGLVAESSETGDCPIAKVKGCRKRGRDSSARRLSAPPTQPASRTPSSRRSTTGRWWSEEPLTRRRSAWSPPILPSAPIGSPPEARRTNFETSTATPSRESKHG